MILGLLVVGCDNSEPVIGCDWGGNLPGHQPNSNTSTNSPPKPTDQNSTKPTPAKELTLREKVVGTYELMRDGDTFKYILLENGITEFHENGKKRESEVKWSIVKEELHIIIKSGNILVHRINEDGSITSIAGIDKDGKRNDHPKDDRTTLKKIK